MQSSEDVYLRIVVEMALTQGQNPRRGVEGIVIFASRQIDPKTKPWNSVVPAYYMDELLEALGERYPDHPLLAVFQPLIENDRDALERKAPAYYNLIKNSFLEPPQKEKLSEVFLSWLLQRFSERDYKEIEKMLTGELPDLVETKAGKQLIAIGEQRGIEQGIEKGIEQGIEKGIEQGSLIGVIQTCQSVLGVDVSKEDALKKQTLESLTAMAKDLPEAVR